jgi:hypothetical protein
MLNSLKDFMGGLRLCGKGLLPRLWVKSRKINAGIKHIFIYTLLLFISHGVERLGYGGLIFTLLFIYNRFNMKSLAKMTIDGNK